MRWKLKSKWLWNEYKEPVKGLFAIGGVLTAIGCIMAAMTVVYSEAIGTLILVWGVVGAMIIYQSHQDTKAAERDLHDEQEEEEGRALLDESTIIQAQCLSCGTLADIVTVDDSPPFHFVCQECTELVLYLLEEYRNEKN